MLIWLDFLVFFPLKFHFSSVLFYTGFSSSLTLNIAYHIYPIVLICAVKFGCCTTDGVVCVGKLTARCREK